MLLGAVFLCPGTYPLPESMGAGFRGGSALSRTERLDFSEVFAPSEFEGPLEAALLLKQTGIALASWTRAPVPQEVVSVMAATMWGSLDTMIRTLGGDTPRSVYLELEERRMLALQVEPNWTLLLVGPSNMGKRRLRREAQRILDRISQMKRHGGPRPQAVRVQG